MIKSMVCWGLFSGPCEVDCRAAIRSKGILDQIKANVVPSFLHGPL